MTKFNFAGFSQLHPGNGLNFDSVCLGQFRLANAVAQVKMSPAKRIDCYGTVTVSHTEP